LEFRRVLFRSPLRTRSRAVFRRDACRALTQHRPRHPSNHPWFVPWFKASSFWGGPGGSRHLLALSAKVVVLLYRLGRSGVCGAVTTKIGVCTPPCQGRSDGSRTAGARGASAVRCTGSLWSRRVRGGPDRTRVYGRRR